MCLAIPGKVVEIEKNENTGEKIGFIIDYIAEKRKAIGSAIDVEIGDYVIVSNKIIINRVSAEDAQEFYKLLN